MFRNDHPVILNRIANLRRWRLARLLPYLGTVWFLLSLNFFIPRAMPGDPLLALQSPGSSSYVRDEASRAAVASYYELDRPLAVQYVRYLGDLVQGDLGYSIRYNRPVADLISERLPWTLLLVGTAILAAAAVGLVAGVQSGWRRGRAVDRALLTLFLSVRNFPVFFLAPLLLFAFSVKLGWFPLAGSNTAFSGGLRSPAGVLDIAHHLALPAFVLALGLATGYYLIMRAGVVGELGSDHLVLGRAKGLSERKLKYRYVARNALLPVVTLAALQGAFAITGAIFVERVFAYPGMGRLLFESVASRDYPALQGCFLVLTAMVMVANLVADLSYRWLDPRTRT